MFILSSITHSYAVQDVYDLLLRLTRFQENKCMGPSVNMMEIYMTQLMNLNVF